MMDEEATSKTRGSGNFEVNLITHLGVIALFSLFFVLI
jgi:hypothetical protein